MLLTAYKRILKDNRHYQVEILLEKQVFSRVMKEWSMGVSIYATVGGNDDDDGYFSKLYLMDELYKSAKIDIIEAITKEIL